MPNSNTQFQGQTLSRPGAYYADNVSAAAAGNPGLVPPLVLIGNGFGGAPKVPVTYTMNDGGAALLAAMRGGPVGALVPFIANPAPGGGLSGASQVTYINAAANTQAQFALMSAGATPVALVTLKTVDYGTPSNLMQISVSPSSSALGNSCMVTIYDGYSNQTVTGDNLGVPFTLQYVGNGSGVTYTVTAAYGSAALLTVTSPNAGESVSIPLGAGQYSTVEQVVQYLNGTGFYNATVISDGTLPSMYLDPVASVSLQGSYANPVAVTAYVFDVRHWVMTRASSLVSVMPASPGANASYSFATLPLTHFTGGTNVPPLSGDYAAAFNAALAIPGWVVVADVASQGIQALGAQHAITASGITGRRPRRFFTGSYVGDTVAYTVASARNLGSTTTSYVYPGVYRTNTMTGLNQLYPGYYVAAAAASIAAGNPVATPLTNKPLQANGCEVALTPTQIDQLQQAGVMPIASSDDGSTTLIVSDQTTWQADNNPENVFNQQIACRQWLQYLLIAAVTPYVGGIAYQGGMGITRNAVIASLNAAVYAPGNNGVLASWDPTSLGLTYTGATQTLAIKVNVTFVGQNRFITVYVPVQALNLTA